MLLLSAMQGLIFPEMWDTEYVLRSFTVYFLVYTKTVDSVFCALWLATQSMNILYYSMIHLQFLRASDAKLA